MQTTGHSVRVVVELTAGVELRHDHLDGGCSRGVHRNGDATSVVDNFDATIFHNGDIDMRGIPGHGFIDGVIDDLPHEVV